MLRTGFHNVYPLTANRPAHSYPIQPIKQPNLPRLSALLALPFLLSLGLLPTARAQGLCTLAGPTSALVGEKVLWQAEGCPADSSLRFSFDAGDTALSTSGFSSRSALSHTYARPGEYTILLAVRSSSGLSFSSTRLSVIYPVTKSRPIASGTLAFDSRTRRLFVVNPDNASVSALGPNHQLLWETPTGANPRSIARDGLGRLWVVNQDDATLSVLEGDGKLWRSATLPRASRPAAVIVHPSGNAVYITLEATGRLLRLDPAALTVTGDIPVVPSAHAMALSGDGERLLVTRLISPDERGEVAEVDTKAFRVIRTFALPMDPGPDDESGGRGLPNMLSAIAISPDGRSAFVAAKKDNIGRGGFRDGNPLTFENTVRAMVCELDLASGREDLSRRRDLDNQSLPSALAFNASGSHLFIANQGSNATLIQQRYIHQAVATIEPADRATGDYDRQLAPIGLHVEGDSLVYIHYFTTRQVGIHRLAEMGLSNDLARIALVKTVGTERLSPQVLRGKRIFYDAGDARMGKDRYMSCAACHLGGGSDGRVWDFTHKGEGLRRTQSLLGKAGLGQGPLHWSANFDEVQDFEHDMRGAFLGQGLLTEDHYQNGRNTSLGGPKAGLSPDLDALAAYVTSLATFRPSPHRNPDGSLTSEALKGKAVFNSSTVGCAVCHSGPAFTDSRFPTAAEKGLPPSERLRLYAGLPGGARSHVTAEGFVLHDVGTLKKASGKRLGADLAGLDTPTLLGVWENRSFFHDGSAPSLWEVITVANPEDRHGKTSHLSRQEKEQLVAYLLQLEGNGTQAGATIGKPVFERSQPSLTVAVTAGRVRLRVRGWEELPVQVSVEDITGKRVALLAPSSRSAGEAVFVWDRRPGADHPQGHYVAVLRSTGGRLLRAPFFLGF